MRLPSFSATVSPVLIGSSYAAVEGHVNLGLFALIMAAAIACQAGANLANDYYDHRRGVDTIARPGSSRVIQQGLLSPRQIKRGMTAAFALATALGLTIVAMTGWVIFVLALACLAAAYFYTAGPKPLGYVALGELTVFFTMGMALVAGSYFAFAGSISTAAILIALPNACLVTAILHVNNMRDVIRDQEAGKRTLAMLLGRSRSNVLYAALLSAAYLLTVLTVALLPGMWPLLGVTLTVPRAIALMGALNRVGDEPGFNRCLRGSNRLLLEFGLLMSAGFVLVAMFK